MFNIGLRAEGIDFRLRRRRAGEWQGERIGLTPRDASPAHIEQAFRCCCSVALAEPGNETALRHTAHAVLALLAAALEAGLPVRGYRNSRQEVRWAQLYECVREHLDQDLDRSRVAALLGIHPNHVSRLCSRQGTRFVDLVQGQRLQVACRMLSDEETSVATIAENCGFGSPQYFSRVFRRRFGCSPGTWRRRHSG